MKENLPIPTQLKIHRLKMKEHIDERCWAFMRELRTHHKGKKIYDVNPYAEVYPVRDHVYAILNESLDGAGDVWMYLIDGPEKALLVDTGFGIGDLKGLCCLLTGGKELIVVNTHPHPDHAFGNCQFDQVYCHEFAVPELNAMNIPTAWDHLFDKEGCPIWSDFDRNDIIPFRNYEIIGVPDGHVFHLGSGHDVELIFTAGHSASHCVFLDRKNRLLFAGDDVISMRVGIHGGKPADPYRSYATVTAYRDQMEKLARRICEFDYIFPGHFIFDLESYVIEDLVTAANAIITNPDDFDYVEIANTPSCGQIERRQKFVPGLGTIGYTSASV